jgi:hypothetical protein
MGAWERAWQQHWSKVSLPGYELPIGGPGGDEREFLKGSRGPDRQEPAIRGASAVDTGLAAHPPRPLVKTPVTSSLRQLVASGTAALALAAGFVAAQTPLDEESSWPRVRTTNGHTVTLHLPQVESWTSNSFSARAAVGLKMAGAKSEWVGVVWLAAEGRVDHSNRLVTLDRIEITRARFPESPDGGTNALAIVSDVVPSGARTVSLDYLITALGFAQAAARQGPRGLKHDPPEIVWATNRTVLILIHGEPVLKAVTGGNLERVVNTPALLVRHKADGRFYLAGDGHWFAASSIQGPWSLAQAPPPEVIALTPARAGNAATAGDQPVPRIVVRTRPAELLMTSGLPDFRPIRGTALLYAADTDSQLFFYSTTREAYLLLSGRWFKAKSLEGPWTYVAPRDLPADMAKIPPGMPQAVVLASVPDSSQAQLAVLGNSVPTTATVSRRATTLQLTYDGEPKFKPIEGTALSYAVNAPLPVILATSSYYALDNGVWFVAPSPAGPWQVATEVPEEIYTIPPSSPVYYATFARVLQSGEDDVEVGYTPGYQGAYEEDGTVVYGTGWDYEPWYGDDYYDWGWTWGYSYWYVPWYQSWVWRNWWDQPGGLRSALIENIYDRWQGRLGVTHHDGANVSGTFKPSSSDAFNPPSSQAFKPPSSGTFKPSSSDAFKPPSSSASKPPSSEAYKPPSSSAFKSSTADAFKSSTSSHGYPAQYGRYQGASSPTALSPPPNTIAFNPYARPTSAVRPGEMPRGAQLLTTVRQSPGGGRDLYASPDGGVYLRKNDGWYRRETGGQWKFAAPAQGSIERSPLASRGGQPGGGQVYRPMPGAGVQGRVGRVPDAGFEARAQEIAALERQYYARSLAQYRAQNWRASGSVNRPSRAGGRRR